MEHGPERESLLYSTCVETEKKDPLSERLEALGDTFEALLQQYKPQAIGVENVFFNKNQKTAIGVAEARGVILFLAQKNGCMVYEFGPQEIKVAVTGYGKSDKKGVIDMVKRLVPNSPTKAHDDEYDAIAVGITCLSHHKA